MNKPAVVAECKHYFCIYLIASRNFIYAILNDIISDDTRDIALILLLLAR